MKPALQRPGLDVNSSVLLAKTRAGMSQIPGPVTSLLPKEESVKKYPHALEEIQHGGCGKAHLEDALSP